MIPTERSTATRNELGMRGIGLDQKRILDLLGEVGEAHNTGIARRLGMTHGHVSRAVSRLVERGLVEESAEIHPDPAVKRQWRLA